MRRSIVLRRRWMMFPLRQLDANLRSRRSLAWQRRPLGHLQHVRKLRRTQHLRIRFERAEAAPAAAYIWSRDKYYEAAKAAGEDVTLLNFGDAGHFEIIDPRSAPWDRVTAVRSVLQKSGDSVRRSGM